MMTASGLAKSWSSGMQFGAEWFIIADDITERFTRSFNDYTHLSANNVHSKLNMRCHHIVIADDCRTLLLSLPLRPLAMRLLTLACYQSNHLHPRVRCLIRHDGIIEKKHLNEKMMTVPTSALDLSNSVH